MSTTRLSTRLSAAVLLAASVAGAAAHDTWFEPLPSTAAGHAGVRARHRQPLPDCTSSRSATNTSSPAAAAATGATAAPLAHVEDRPVVLVVRSATPLNPRAALTCWAQLAPFDVEVPPDKIELYLREIQASPALREIWAAMKARGLPWRERYTKHARIEFGGAGPRTPLAIGMDVLLDSPRWPVRAGDALGFQVLRNGAPLANLPVELVSEHSALGIWRKTDAEGRVRVTAPLAGRWLLRARRPARVGEEPRRMGERLRDAGLRRRAEIASVRSRAA